MKFFKKLQSVTFKPWTVRWLKPQEAGLSQKTFFPPQIQEWEVQGGGRESEELLVSNSNIVQKGEREQMAVENAASKLWRKGLFWQILLFPIQAWTLWHGELRRYKEQPLFPATSYEQLASEALWEKQHERETDRQTDMATSPGLRHQKKNRKARNSCLFLAPV